ncbi:hypothetical protein [Aestuariivivens insulae]|uniref:hypothetical protein n=1 Tax=Aestuariivivens insulae TaxID=1621988 RepID=UPI001F59EF93|nr:hypothetical protein [Aestuariivivens insulae]
METKKKWYNRYILGYLLIFFPPLGLYGIYKSETVPLKWKKVTYAAFALAMIGLIVMYSI